MAAKSIVALVLTLALGVGCGGTSKTGYESPPGPTVFESDAGGDGALAGPSCAAVSLGAKHRPLDLFILMDKSGSMYGIPWLTASRAMEDFFAHPPSSDISAALNVFPISGVSCTREPYRLFAVDIGPLPARAPALAAKLDATVPSGGTPTQIALDGALFVATAYKRAHTDHVVAAVLVSDGVPQGCDNSGLLTLPKIALEEEDTLTFAIGIGAESAGLMDGLAAAGGTGHALNVTEPSQIGDRLREAQVQAVGCELLVPDTAPDGRKTDPTLVNVVISDSFGDRTIPKLDGETNCGNREGWYYADPKNPSLIRLCSASCTAVKARVETKVDVTLGCKSAGPR